MMTVDFFSASIFSTGTLSSIPEAMCCGSVLAVGAVAVVLVSVITSSLGLAAMVLMVVTMALSDSVFCDSVVGLLITGGAA